MTSTSAQVMHGEFSNDVDATAQTLVKHCADVLSISLEQIDLASSFASLGGKCSLILVGSLHKLNISKGDSFRAVLLHRRCFEEGIHVSLRDILLKKSLAQIAAAACERHADATSSLLLAGSGSQDHPKFSRMPRDYDFNAIREELQNKVHQSSESGLDLIDDVYPCSPMQEAMFIGQKTRTTQLYRTIGLFKVRTATIPQAVERCWQQVVNRHQTLRTIYVPAAGGTGRLLDAVVLRNVQASVSHKRCRDKTEVQEKYISRCNSDSPFMNGVLHQAFIWSTDNGEIFCILDLSHMITDGSSWVLLIEDFSRALRGIQSLSVAPGYDRYVDYIRLDPNADAALDYWMQYLEEVEPCKFPVLDGDIRAATEIGELFEVQFTEFDELQRFCKHNETTISAVLQTAWALLLRNYTGNSDVCFGYLSSGRSLPIHGVEAIVGPLINLLICKATGLNDRSARSILEEIQADFVDALPHQCVSLQQVHQILGMNDSFLFNTLVTVHYAPAMVDGSTELALLASSNKTEFDIVVKVLYSEDNMRVRLSYRPTVLSRSMAERVTNTFSTAISILLKLDNLDQSLGPIDCLSSGDRDQINDWNMQTFSSGGVWHPTTIHSLIENTAKCQPDALAVDAWDGAMSYERINELSTTLANEIMQLGIGPGLAIPLCFEKSAWYTVALLAVLKSGNAFVPVDRSNPTNRICQILRQLDIDVNSGLVITSREHVQTFVPLCKHVIPLEPNFFAKEKTYPRFNMPEVSAHDKAYVIFTSGSTGMPKGVVVEHGAYAYAARAHQGGLHISNTSRVLQFASYGFDTSMEDHLTTLIVGGCLCVPSEEERLSDLVGFANRSKANWAHLTPSVANIFNAEETPVLKTMVLGGEAMTLRNVQAWAGRPNKRLIQVYGPSECCVTSTISEDVSYNMDPTNIGRALPGCASWIVRIDTPHALAPIGVVGELLVEGPILARGYLIEPEKTISSFVTGLEWAPQKRLYRTKDLVYYDSEGDLHFVGRVDAQVKVHGQRIEPGEIERNLALEGSLLHSIVLVPNAGPCAGILVAVIAHQRQSTQDVYDMATFERPETSYISNLRNFLLDLVPHYMIPAIWLVVRDMPHNTSGKLDRKRMLKCLEEMDDDEYDDLVGSVENFSVEPPINSLEMGLREVWSTVLNVPEADIGRSNTFFSYGGDSISAMAVSSAARARGIAISAAKVLRHQTIGRLMENLDTDVDQALFADFGRTEIGVAWPLSPIQQMHFQASAKGDPLDQQVMVLSITKHIPDDLLHNAFRHIVEVHPMLRARFTPTIDGWVQHITDDVSGSFALRFHHADCTHKDIVQRIGSTKLSVDMVNGPLVGIDIFGSGEKRFVSVTIHHLVVDAVSWRVILEDLEGIIARGAPARPEPVHFQAWGRAQVEQARTRLDPARVLPAGLDIESANTYFWKMEGQPVFFQDSASKKLQLSKASSQAFGACKCHGFDQVDLLSAAVLLSFLDLFGRPSASLFVEGHGREPFYPGLDLSRTVGWFTTLAPIAIDKTLDAVAALRKIRDLRKTTPNKGYDYFTSRFLNKKGVEAFQQQHWPMEIVLNHLGRYQQLERQDALFRRCEPALQSMLSQLRLQQRVQSQRYSLITILSAIEDGVLTVTVEWNKYMKHQKKLKSWPAMIKEQLERLLDIMCGQAVDPLAELAASAMTIGISQQELHGLLEAMPTSPGVLLGNIEAAYPCSPMQESLLFSQLKNTNPYNQHFLFQLMPGYDDPLEGRQERLSKAWARVVEKHAILRTVFAESSSHGFMQIVLRKATPMVEWIRSKSKEAVVKTWEQDLLMPGPLPLSGKLLHSLKIYIVEDGTIFCQLDKNHIISDGISSRIMIQDLLDAYGDRLEGLSASFSDYINHINETDAGEAEKYWSRYLDSATRCHFPQLAPPVNKGSQAIPTEKVELVLDNKRALELKCRNFGISNSSALQAAWALVLKTYLNSEAVIFGFLASGRDIPIPGIDKIVGPMVNMLPVRVQVTPGSSMIELARGIQEDYLEHLSWQTVSLGRMQRAVGGGDSLFNTIVNIQKSPVAQNPIDTNPKETTAELVKSHDASEYGVAVTITDEQDRYIVSVEFATSLLSVQQACHVVAAFGRAVDLMVQEPEKPVAEASLFSQLDEQLVQAWNIDEPCLVQRCIQELIQESVQRQPASTAVCSWDGELTYEQLDRFSSGVACRLVSSGVQPEHVVALCFEKSMWGIVAMVGVAKSGGTFVHIDPQAPRARVQAITEQTRCKVALVALSCHTLLDDLVGDVLLLTSHAAEEWCSMDVASLATVQHKPTNALYVIFTSGSTGTPKGVVIEHQNFCSAVIANREWLQIQATSRVLQFTSYSFDASLEETFTALVAGACICVPSEQDRMSDVTGFIQRAAVNWAAFTPSFLRSLEPHDVSSLDFMTVHAEPMSQALVARWADLVHMRPSYGPTECSVTSAVGKRMTARSDAANIGWPVGCRGWVVDPGCLDTLVPVGAIGELVLEGPIVGRGYLRDQQKTAAAFVTFSPAGQKPRRVYCTGDLVRYATDGSLIILGRRDDSQVKVRGQRVELAEIQHHLDLVPDFANSLVLLPSKGPLQGKLTVVASLKDDIDPCPSSLQLIHSSPGWTSTRATYASHVLTVVQKALSCKLPTYMVPHTWLLVGKLPLQISCKIDRKLVATWLETLDPDAVLVANRLRKPISSSGSKVEETIRRVWADVLAIDHCEAELIHLDDPFFAMGGDSISAMQVTRQCRAMGLSLTTQNVLVEQTIRKLAVIAASERPVATLEPQIEAAVNVQQEIDPTVLLPAGSSIVNILPCSPFQEYTHQALQTDPTTPYLYHTLVEITSDVGLNATAAARAWRAVVDRHSILRTVFVPAKNGDKIYQVVLHDSSVDCSITSVDKVSSIDETANLHMTDIRSKCLASAVPPLALRLFVLDSGRMFALLAIGHMIIDHVSLTHILSDWDRFCRGWNPLSDLDVLPPFRHYIHHLSSRNLAYSTNFWEGRLRNLLPCQVSDPNSCSVGDSQSMGAVSFTIETAGATQTFCKTTGVTLSNLLQFAWALVLHVYTGQDTVCFGYLVSDRDIDTVDSDEIVGPLLSLVVGQVTISESLVESMLQLQSNNINASEHKVFDIAEVGRRLRWSSKGFSSAFNTLFNYRKVVRRNKELPTMRFQSIRNQDPHEVCPHFSNDPTPTCMSPSRYVFDKKIKSLIATFSNLLC
ncbi:nonribosomal peptide synthetase 5 [Bipolaris maydis]|nr:nonribosomal peptide synthetase 5 [Bipolaris maydis]